MKWHAVFFDFDGVILDSVDVKTRAFAAMFRAYGPKVEQAVVDYHLANGGVSRYDKFKYYYKYLLKKPISQDTLDALGRKFNQLAIDGVLSAPFNNGALESLKQLKKKGIPAFVVSGTPDDEIRFIVKKRKLTSFFMEVHGSPRKKEEIILDIGTRYSRDLGKCLFIGDAMTDYFAARHCGTDFLGVVKSGEPSPFPEGTVVSLDSVDLTIVEFARKE
jgi:phosphoglycolate phosphatase-like HAD superfamily hydrolase